ncbi:MAG: ABC transporter ATP-binding protein [Pseudomonadota bacterium]
MAIVSLKQSAGVAFAADLEFADIHLHYGDVHVLKGISLKAEAGEVICLLGPSGSGKTSMLRVAAGLEPQTSGRVTMNGQVIAGDGVFVPPEKRQVGLMFQDFALFPHMTVMDNVRFGLKNLGRSGSVDEARRAIERVGLDHHTYDYPNVLSGGEQQRIALARALAPRPSVMLMDEPFSGLDTRLKDEIRAQTLNVLRETRATTIVVTHDAEEAMRMGDRIALLRNGQIVQFGTAQELYHRPVDLFTASFFAELNTITVKVGDGRVETPLGVFDAPAHLSKGAFATVAVRVSGFDVEAADGAVEGINGRIVSRRFLGDTEQLTLAVPGQTDKIAARVRAGVLADGVRDVRISVRTEDIMVFESPAQRD